MNAETAVFVRPPLGVPDAGDLFLFRDTDGTAQTELVEFTALQTALGTGGGGGSTTPNPIYYAHMADIVTTADTDAGGPQSVNSTTWVDFTSGLTETINVGGFTTTTTGTPARDKGCGAGRCGWHLRGSRIPARECCACNQREQPCMA